MNEDLNAKIRALKPDDLAAIEVATSGAMGRPGEVSFLLWSDEMLVGQAWDSVLRTANVDSKLIENVIAAIRANPNWNYVNLGMGNSLYLNDTFTAFAVEQMRGKHPFTAWKETLSRPKKVASHRSEPGFCNKFRQIQTKELVEHMCERIAAKDLESVQADLFKVIPPFLSYKQEANIDRTYFISDEIEANCYIQHEDFRRILVRICTAFLSWNDFERGKALRDKYGEFDSMWSFLGGALTAFEALTIEYIGEGTHDVIVCMLYRFFEGRRDESVAKEFGLLGEDQ